MSSPPQVTHAVTAWPTSPSGVLASARSRVARTRSVTLRGFMTASITVVIAAALCLPIGAATQIVLVSQLDDRTPTQALVVLDPVRNWGQAGPVIKARAEHAAQLYRDGVASVILLPGTERSAQRSREVLLGQGVAAADIVAFETGADTVGSMRSVAEAMRGLDWSSATIVTDPAQAARVQATAGTLGLDAHLSPTDAGPGTALTAEYVGRETVALLRYYLVTRWTQEPVLHP